MWFDRFPADKEPPWYGDSVFMTRMVFALGFAAAVLWRVCH